MEARLRFDDLMTHAEEYHKQALWQEKLRTLQEALEISNQVDFPEQAESRQHVLFELGGVWRRSGQYEKAVQTLREALQANTSASPITQASILGEMGVVYMNTGDFQQSQQCFQQQFEMASNDSCAEAEAEQCRAVGNEGMSFYHRYQQSEPKEEKLLKLAFERLEGRVDRAQRLIDRLTREQPESALLAHSGTWKIIGLHRLSLCHIAAGEASEAVRAAEKAHELQREHQADDPTVRGLSVFFLGNALLADGRRDEAVHTWTSLPGTCSPAVAICKEPSAENVTYLKALAEAGIDLSPYDDQGFSALDYAVLSDNPDAQKIVQVLEDAARDSLRKQLQPSSTPSPSGDDTSDKIEAVIKARRDQAKLRRFYRGILQEEIRPELRKESQGSISNLRQIYADTLEKDQQKQSTLDRFYYVDYNSFKKVGKIPKADEISSGSSSRPIRSVASESTDGWSSQELFIIFFSYRWLGTESDTKNGGVHPDDEDQTQYKRILHALESFLKRRPDLNPEDVGIWLDCACISQDQPVLREKGINSLPLAVTQCNAMISLVDSDYYTRAWCSVEVMLVRELIKSYRLHEWWEHVLDSPEEDPVRGSLVKGDLDRDLDISTQRLSKEELDRPKVEFLLRQSKLLGRDNA